MSSAAEYTQRAETVHGEPVVYRRLSLAERKSDRGEVSDFALVGRVAGGDLELWKANGRWRENDAPYFRDLAITLPKQSSAPHP
jgi:hypothetical protein